MGSTDVQKRSPRVPKYILNERRDLQRLTLLAVATWFVVFEKQCHGADIDTEMAGIEERVDDVIAVR